MIPIKTDKELEAIRQSGSILAGVKRVVAKHIKPGVTFAELDHIAEGEILKRGGQVSFKKVPGYQWATCINKNEGLVHGIPGDQKVEPGDKISVDIGVWYKGFHTDSAFSVVVPPATLKLDRFLETGRQALNQAIERARPGKRIGHISEAIEKTLHQAGYAPVYLFTGHGVGGELHEDPPIPCFLYGDIKKTPRIEAGMVLAIEAIYAQGKPDAVIDHDGWTAVVKDGTMGGLFEETVIVTDQGPEVVTR